MFFGLTKGACQRSRTEFGTYTDLASCTAWKPLTKTRRMFTFQHCFLPVFLLFSMFWLWQVMEEAKTCFRQNYQLLIEEGQQETVWRDHLKRWGMEFTSIWLALSCLTDIEHGIFTNNERRLTNRKMDWGHLALQEFHLQDICYYEKSLVPLQLALLHSSKFQL